MYFQTVYVPVICFLWMSVGYGEPDLKYFVDAVCKDSTPYKCPPSAKCYNYEQYCTSDGEVETCFPHEMSANDSTILEWCRGHNSMPHPTCKFACFSKFGERYSISAQDGGPDLKYFVDAVCKESKPYKCPPSAICYNYEQYCTTKGEVESCFPHEMSANDAAILKWCRQPDSSLILPHPTCKFACFSKFGERLFISDQVTSSTVNTVTNSTSKDSTSCDCQEDSSGYTWAILGLTICLAIFLAVSVTLNVMLFLRLRRTQRRQIPTVEDAWTQDDSKHTAGNNKQGNVNDKTEEPAAPPPVDILEADRTLNQLPLDETNLPSSFLVDRVPGRSTNTQSHAPINQGDPVEGRNTNTQNGTQIDHEDQARYRSTNTQNGTQIDQEDPFQGRRANIQNDAATIQFVSVQGGTRHTQHGQVRYLPQHTASLASTSLRRHNDGTPEELAELIPRNHTTESDKTISLGPAPTDQSIHANPTSPEAAGRPPDGTHDRNLD